MPFLVQQGRVSSPSFFSPSPSSSPGMLLPHLILSLLAGDGRDCGFFELDAFGETFADIKLDAVHL